MIKVSIYAIVTTVRSRVHHSGTENASSSLTIMHAPVAGLSRDLNNFLLPPRPLIPSLNIKGSCIKDMHVCSVHPSRAFGPDSRSASIMRKVDLNGGNALIHHLANPDASRPDPLFEVGVVGLCSVFFAGSAHNSTSSL